MLYVTEYKTILYVRHYFQFWENACILLILDLFFSNIFAVLYKLEVTVYVTVFPQMWFTFQSYVLQCCLGFMIVLSSLGAVVNEFICNQWERKGMKQMFISLVNAIWDQRQISFIML
jgi:hypothetical protein